MTSNKLKKAADALMKNKYALLVLLLGAALILWPRSTKAPEAESSPPMEAAEPEYSLEQQEKRLGDAISKIEDAGEVLVLLAVSGSASQELATTGPEDETLVVKSGSSVENVVPLRYLYPQYTGAVVICEGGDKAAVRLAVTQAVASLTGLSSDKITVIKMKTT